MKAKKRQVISIMPGIWKDELERSKEMLAIDKHNFARSNTGNKECSSRILEIKILEKALKIKLPKKINRQNELKQASLFKTSLPESMIEIFGEHLEQCKKILQNRLENLAKFPKGSLHKKTINSKKYVYLVWREQGKLISKYICKSTDFTKIRDIYTQILIRKELEEAVEGTILNIAYLNRALKIGGKHDLR